MLTVLYCTCIPGDVFVVHLLFVIFYVTIFYILLLIFVQLLPTGYSVQSTKLIPKSHPLTDPNQKCPRTQRIEL